MNLKELISHFDEMKVLVIGDVFLDKYYYYDPSLGEPSLETNLIPTIVTKKIFTPGAAGNIAKNLALLGAQVFLIGIIGKDGDGHELLKALRRFKVNTEYIVRSYDRKTQFYTKFININENIEDKPRVDFINKCSISVEEERMMIKNVEEVVKQVDAVIVMDQTDIEELGTITDNLRRKLKDLRVNLPNKIFFADSRKRIWQFPGFFIKPNAKEIRILVENIIGKSKKLPNVVFAQKYAPKISRKMGSPMCITLGEEGSLIVDDKNSVRIWTPKVKIRDVCGAGDAFTSAYVLALLVDNKYERKPDLISASILGNLAASICVSQVGTGEVRKDDILKKIIPMPVKEVYHPDIYLINPFAVWEKVRFIIFDFDGTLSLLREGWEKVMEPVMIEAITGSRDLPIAHLKKIKEKIKRVIDQTTGVQTIIQMEGLVDMVREEGLVPDKEIKSALEYKKIYNDRILRIVLDRMQEVKSGKKDREDFLIKGSMDFLKALRNKNITLFLASGTDRIDVLREANFLGIDNFFNGGIYGALESYEEYSKEKVIREIIDSNSLKGNELLVIGDGPVEIEKGKENSALTVGVASDEKFGCGWNMKKIERLKRSGADLLIPDFTMWEVFMGKLFKP